MASFRKRSNGKWQAAILLHRTSDGEKRMQYITRDTLGECKMAVLEVEYSLKEKRRKA